jgi:hypothetical protein
MGAPVRKLYKEMKSKEMVSFKNMAEQLGKIYSLKLSGPLKIVCII